MSETLLEETIRMARESGLSAEELAREAGVGGKWLRRLLAGDYIDPGVNKIEKLCKHLRRQAGKAA